MRRPEGPAAGYLAVGGKLVKICKDWIEKMKWKNEIGWNLSPFPDFLPFFYFFPQLLSKYRQILSSSAHRREIPTKFHWNLVEKSANFIDFSWNEMKFHFIRAKIWTRFLLNFLDPSGAKAHKSCRSRKMLKNAPTLAIIAVHTAENEPLKVLGVIQFNIQSTPY